MGPAVLITLGLLFLLSNTSDWQFERTWPILLIVIGAIKVTRYVMTDSGHINPGQVPLPYGVPYGQYPPTSTQGYAAPVQNAAPVTAPPSSLPPAPMLGEGENGEVHNG
jgi:hypothetical protein